MENMLNQVRRSFSLEELDTGSFCRLKVSAMNFRIRCFRAEGLGHVSVMTASGLLGLMKMQTLIINPFDKDAPLLSYDRIQAMGKDSLYLELYNTMLSGTDLSRLDEVTRKYRHLADFDPGSHWYDPIKLPQSLFKRGKARQSADFSAAARDFLDAYLLCCEQAPQCSIPQKKAAAAAYTQGLLEHGGPAVDVFIRSLGREKTAGLLTDILFGA